MSETNEDESPEPLVENLDFYFEGGFMVLTGRYLLRRGFCCKNGCRHCPYETSEDIDS